MPKFYIESEQKKLVIDRETQEEAAKSFIGLNPDLVYEAMKTSKTMFVHVDEKGFGGPYRTDSMFDVIELVYRMGPSGE
tara:strand:+ start:471 stop:707 length:237 start_codon:yes stop_codon:yes gene_type:complete